MEIGVLCVLSVFAGLNSKDSSTSTKASLKDIVVLYASDLIDSMTFVFDLGPTSTVITLSTTSVSVCSLSYSSLSSFSALTQLAFSLHFLEPSGSCHIGPRLLSKFLSLIFCAALATVAKGFSVTAIGLSSCSNSVSQVFLSSELDDQSLCSFSFSFS